MKGIVLSNLVLALFKQFARGLPSFALTGVVFFPKYNSRKSFVTPPITLRETGENNLNSHQKRVCVECGNDNYTRPFIM